VNNNAKKMARAVLATAILVSGTAAQATIISAGSNNPLNFSWSYTTSSNTLLTGFGSMTLSGFNTNSLTLLTSLTNTSSLGGQGGERLTALGFAISPNATGVSFSDTADSGLINAALGQNFPQYQEIEVCAFGGQNCAGGGHGGIYGAGGTDTFTINLLGIWGSSVDIDPIGFKYQTGYGSFEFTTSSSTSTSSGNVSEPATSSIALLALGFLGYGLRRKLS
jgi:hypothetical protein